MTIIASVEVTDLFGGEPNYSWVRRYRFNANGMTDRQIEREARKLACLTGVKCDREDYGDLVRWIPRGTNTVVYLTVGDTDA